MISVDRFAFWALILGIGTFLGGSASAADSSPSEQLSIDDVLELQVSVASPKAETIRQSPSVLTVITHEEIVTSGARELTDILNSVAGFTFDSHTQNVVSPGFRGNWGDEGKILLLIDGMEMNELFYGTVVYGNRFLVDNIERIEIMRGPGSAIYGGFAELAVINIIMRGADAVHGGQAAITYGEFLHGFARRNVSAAYGHSFLDNDLKVAVNGFWGQGNASGEIYRDYSGISFRESDGAERQDPIFVNLDVDYKGLRLRFLYEKYRMSDRTSFGQTLDEYYNANFTSIFANLTYDWKPLPWLTITPELQYKFDQPWNVVDDRPNAPNEAAYQQTLDLLFYDKYANRFDAKIVATAEPIEDLSLVLGLRLTFDEGYVSQHGAPLTAPRGSNTPFVQHIDPTTGVGIPTAHASYQNYALFAQGMWTNPWVSLTAGVRGEHNSQYGNSFVPRLALTKVLGPFNAKLLGAQSFRTPTFENISLNTKITPEKTTSFELELGYRISDEMFATVNIFDISIDNVIAYDYDAATNTEIYNNFPHTGTYGVEFEYQYKSAWGLAKLSYSFYAPAGGQDVPIYNVPGHPDTLLGFANHKVALSGTLRAGSHVRISPGVIMLGPRYGYLTNPDTVSKADTTFLLNLFVTYQDLGINGLALSAGMYNILGQSFTFIEAYNGGHAPVPGMDRQIGLRLSYQLDQDTI